MLHMTHGSALLCSAPLRDSTRPRLLTQPAGTSSSNSEIGIYRVPIVACFDNEPSDSGILSQDTGKIWYDSLVGGLRHLLPASVPEGAKWGFECDSFVIDTGRYLGWLQNQCLSQGMEVHRKSFASLDEALRAYEGVDVLFNCTGLGSYHLGGVQDTSLYPTRGQVMLVEQPAVPARKMYFRSPRRVASDTTYVFPRGPHGGIILGGCRDDGVWEGEVRMDFAEDIKKRCCALCPELGSPEDLKVVSHGVGLRPGRKGGARIEREVLGCGTVVVHNYGAGGAGYQASWGMAREAVTVLTGAM